MYCNDSLGKFLARKRPRVIAIMCGMGDFSGPYCNHNKAGVHHRIPDSFWASAPEDHMVYLFSYSCHSYQYLRQSEAMEHIEAAIAFDDFVWFTETPESVIANGFWTSFVADLCALTAKWDEIDKTTYVNLARAYTDAYAKGYKKRRWAVRRSKIDYLTRLCLFQQLNALKMIEK